jgi:DNA-binding transcriptional LysR family regulator
MRLFDAGLFAFLPPGDKRRKNSSIRMEQIADDRFLVLRKGFLTRSMFDHACVEAGVRPRILLESDSTHTLISLARDGHGIAILSSSARDTNAIKHAIPMVSAGGKIRQTVSAIWNPNRYRPASLPAFAAMLEKHAKQPH